MNNNEACAEYFKEQPVFKRCFREFEKKWKSYGKAAGTIVLKNASEAEKRAIGGIIGRVFYEDVVRFSFAEFGKGLQQTKFAPVDFSEVLEAYCGRKIVTKQEEQIQGAMEKAEFFEEAERYLTEYAGQAAIAVFWLREMVSGKNYGYQIVIREYKKDREQARKLLKTVGIAIAELEKISNGEELPLAVFAAEISGNPHYFDHGTAAGQLLVHGICYRRGLPYPQNAHQWREVLLSNEIVPDTISSIVHVYGLRIQINGSWHPAYDAFCRLQDSCAVTLENLQNLTDVQPVGNKVYIVENEMVFSYLLKQLKQKKITLLCTSGQLRSASVKLIRSLSASGAEIYYSGDIDPDGIRIADRLWKKYGDRIHIWRMSESDYEKSISEEMLGNTALKKLEAVEHPILAKTAERVKKKKKAGYQENILSYFVEDIEKQA